MPRVSSHLRGAFLLCLGFPPSRPPSRRLGAGGAPRLAVSRRNADTRSLDTPQVALASSSGSRGGGGRSAGLPPCGTAWGTRAPVCYAISLPNSRLRYVMKRTPAPSLTLQNRCNGPACTLAARPSPLAGGPMFACDLRRRGRPFGSPVCDQVARQAEVSGAAQARLAGGGPPGARRRARRGGTPLRQTWVRTGYGCHLPLSLRRFPRAG